MNAQQKNLAGLLVAAGLAGAVGLYAYFAVLKGDAQEAEKKAADERLVSLPAGDGGEATFTALRVTSRGQTTELELREEGWFLTAPLQTRADASVVEQLIRELSAGRVKATIEAAPDDAALKRYGLSPPQFAVSGTANPGATGFKIEGGIENPYDGSVYLRRGEDPAVYSAGIEVRTALDRSTFDLRDKRLLETTPDAVSRVEVAAAGKPAFVLVREGATGWKLERPIAAEADAELVGEMLSSLVNERVTGFPEVTADLDKALATPAQDVSVTLKDGKTVRLQFARSGERVIGRRGSPEVFEVGPSALEHLDRSAAELRDRSVLRFDRDAVTHVVFHPEGGGTPIEVRRSVADADAGLTEAWTVTAPETGPVKQWKMSSVLWAFSSLKAHAPAADGPGDWNRFGLGDRARRVQLYGAEEVLLAELVIGAAVKGAPDRVYGRGNKPGLFEVETAMLTELPTDVRDLLEQPAAAADAGTASP